jgi:hypothetical protein
LRAETFLVLLRPLRASPVAEGLAMSWAHLMNSCANGLRVRFLSVIIPICLCVVGSSTGNILMDVSLAENLNMEAGTTARKCPVAASLIRILDASA